MPKPLLLEDRQWTVTAINPSDGHRESKKALMLLCFCYFVTVVTFNLNFSLTETSSDKLWAHQEKNYIMTENLPKVLIMNLLFGIMTDFRQKMIF